MNPDRTLIFTSTLGAICFTLHWSDEITRGLEQARIANLPGVGIILVWLIGSLILGARRSGYIIMLIAGILGMGVMVGHMLGNGFIGRRIANTDGIFFWVFILLTIGVSSALSTILAARGLWLSRGARSDTRLPG